MGSAFHQLCPRYSGTLTPTAPTAIRLWDTFTFYSECHNSRVGDAFGLWPFISIVKVVTFPLRTALHNHKSLT